MAACSVQTARQEHGLGFHELGDQFLAACRRAAPRTPTDGRHFGLGVDNKDAVTPAALEKAAGIKTDRRARSSIPATLGNRRGDRRLDNIRSQGADVAGGMGLAHLSKNQGRDQGA